MYTAENAPGVAVLLSGDADVPGPLTGLPTHQDNLDTVIGRYSRLRHELAEPRTGTGRTVLRKSTVVVILGIEFVGVH